MSLTHVERTFLRFLRRDSSMPSASDPATFKFDSMDLSIAMSYKMALSASCNVNPALFAKEGLPDRQRYPTLLEMEQEFFEKLDPQALRRAIATCPEIRQKLKFIPSHHRLRLLREGRTKEFLELHEVCPLDEPEALLQEISFYCDDTDEKSFLFLMEHFPDAWARLSGFTIRRILSFSSPQLLASLPFSLKELLYWLSQFRNHAHLTSAERYSLVQSMAFQKQLSLLPSPKNPGLLSTCLKLLLQ